MAISAFDQPTQAQFTNTYVPIPFQEILQAGQARQQRYDINRSSFEKMAAEANELRAIPGSADESYIEGTVIPVMKQISDQYATQDYGNTEVVRQINKQLRENIDRRLVGNIQQSYAGYQQYQDDLRKLQLSGATVPPELAIDPRQHSTRDIGIFSGTPERALDLESRAREYFKNIEPRYKGIRPVDERAGIYGLVHGVDQATLNQRVSDITDEFLNSPEGQQFSKIQQRRGVQDIPGAAKQFLGSIGQEELKDRVTSTFKGASEASSHPKFGTGLEYFLPATPVPEEQQSYKKANRALNTLRRTGENPVVEEQYSNLIAPAEDSKQDFISQRVGTIRNDFDREMGETIRNTIPKNEQSRFINTSYYAAVNDLSIENAYLELHGEKPPRKYYQTLPEKGVSRSDYDKIKSKYRRRYGKLEREGDDVAEKTFDLYANKSESQSVVTIPQVRISEGVAYSYDRGADDWIPDASSQLYATILENVTPQMATPISETKDKKLEKYNEAPERNIKGAGVDEKGNFLHVVTYSQDKNDNRVKEGDYKVYLPTYTQNEALASSFRTDSDEYNYIRFTHPHVESVVEMATKGGGVSLFEIPITNEDKVVADRNPDGTYNLSISGTNQIAGPFQPGEIAPFIYETIRFNVRK